MADEDSNLANMARCRIAGLAVGTAYWVDLAAKAVTTASTVGLSNVNITVIEQ